MQPDQRSKVRLGSDLKPSCIVYMPSSEHLADIDENDKKFIQEPCDIAEKVVDLRSQMFCKPETESIIH